MQHPVLGFFFVLFQWFVVTLRQHPFETVGITVIVIAILVAIGDYIEADWNRYKRYRQTY